MKTSQPHSWTQKVIYFEDASGGKGVLILSTGAHPGGGDGSCEAQPITNSSEL